MKKGLILTFLTCTMSMFLSASLFIGAKAQEDRILNGIYAGNIPLGGYTQQEAYNAVKVCVDELLSRNITLYTVNDEEVDISPSDVGFYWSNPEIIEQAAAIGHSGNVVTKYKSMKDLGYTGKIFRIEYGVDEKLIEQLLNERCAIYDCEAVDGVVSLVDGQFVVEQGKKGSRLDVPTSVSEFKDFLCHTWTGENTAYQLAIIDDEPRGNIEDFSQVKSILGSYHTSFKSSGGARSKNVKNGGRLINGDVIYPGEEYSFYDHIKPFTAENGYEMASAYSAGMVVDSIGGGICQVSSTLYNAVLYAELEVTSRRNHSMIVTYVEPARDATIAESAGIDFKFMNNTDAPIYIDAYTTDDKQLYVNIYGHETRPEGRTVEYESEIVSKTEPEGENIYTDSSLPIGTVSVTAAHVGYKANLWKVVTENGETTKELVNTSTYKPVAKYATVGMATDNPSLTSMMQSAIDTGSIDQVKAMAANIKAGYLSQEDINAAALAQYQAALEAMQAAEQVQ